MGRFLLVSIVFVLTATGCRQVFGKRVKGNGNITTINRSVSGFSGIDVSSSIDVYIKQDSSYSVQVVTDDNLQQHVMIRESGGTLYIEPEKGFNLRSSSGIKVYVSGSSLRKFNASGSCDIYSQNQLVNTESVSIRLSGACDADLDLKSPRIEASLSGAGDLKLKGQTRDLELDGTGSSSLKCIDMMAENVEVDITGSGNAEVFASVKLDVSVTGAGSVKYKGNPTINQKVSGAGSVKKID
jgi:hypothetical protein